MGGWAGLMYKRKGAAPFPTVPGFGPLCRLLFPQHRGFVLMFRLMSLTPSGNDEVGLITLSAQPTQSVKNECEQQSAVLSTVGCLAGFKLRSDLFVALYKLYYLKQVPLYSYLNSLRQANPLSNLFSWNLAVNDLCQVKSYKIYLSYIL